MLELNILKHIPITNLSIAEHSFVLIQDTIRNIREEYQKQKKSSSKDIMFNTMHLRYLKGSLDGQIYVLSNFIIVREYSAYEEIHDLFIGYRNESNFYLGDLSK